MLTTQAKANKDRALSDVHKPKAGHQNHVAGCLWAPSLKWVTATVDEGHQFRTANRNFHGLNCLLGNSYAKIIATATPLSHTPKVSIPSSIRSNILIVNYVGLVKSRLSTSPPIVFGRSR